VYLSRLMLNPLSRDVWRDLGDCRQMHRTIMSGFPDVDMQQGVRAKLGILYRIEMKTNEGQVIAYVQSKVKPDWKDLVEVGYLPPASGDSISNPTVKSISEHYDTIRNGDELRFRLLANPTKKVGTTTKSQRKAGIVKNNGRRVGILNHDRQIEWLRRKGDQNGFELLSVQADNSISDVVQTKMRTIYGRRKTIQSNPITMHTVMFDGRLRVVDIDIFRSALRNGIGPGKAYGCGLLSITR
jgi:CRISPR system Cascade subunit CasE